MDKKLFGYVIAAIIVITGGWLLVNNSTQRQRQAPTQTTQGKDAKVIPAPDFNLSDYTGKTVNLTDFVGKNLIINSWATWCPFCKAELFDFAVAQKEFGDQVVIIAIDRAEALETAKKFSGEVGVSDKLIMLLDPKDSFYQSIGGFSMPETIFVNKQGQTVFHKRGSMDLEEIRQRVQDLIKEE